MTPDCALPTAPVEPELLGSSDEPENEVRGPVRMDRIEEEAPDECFTEMEEREENRGPKKASDTIPPGLFYPSFMGTSGSDLKLKLINQSLTAKSDNILHFLSADGECITPVSKLLLDLGKIDKRHILMQNPNNVIITNKTNTKVFTGILKQKHFEEYSLQELMTVLENLAD